MCRVTCYDEAMQSRALIGTVLVCMLGACSVLFAPGEEASPAVDASDLRRDSGAGSDARRDDAGFTTCTSMRDGGICVIDCTTPDCDGDIRCPNGIRCEVNCIGDQACENVAIDCLESAECEINCSGTDACDLGGITCNGNTCAITCSGDAACEEGPVFCNAAECSIRCDGPNTCAASVCCYGFDCGDACSAAAGGSCTCPQ
jgi:hypothetical protein